ncbi:hypothetical protein DL98DRAFT_577310 [Cadophora sp. DSE1049]|nr:hypothetical protein DL98DRAFT_577310 [Cadophora sp. DSE1049]
MEFSYNTQMQWILSKVGTDPATNPQKSGIQISKLDIHSTYVDHLRRIKMEYPSAEETRQEWLSEISTFREFSTTPPESSTAFTNSGSQIGSTATQSAILQPHASLQSETARPPQGRVFYRHGQAYFNISGRTYDVPNLRSNTIRFIHAEYFPALSDPKLAYFKKFGRNFPMLQITLDRPLYDEVQKGGPVDIEVKVKPGLSLDQFNIAARDAPVRGLRQYAARCAPGRKFHYILDYYNCDRDTFHPEPDQAAQDDEINAMIRKESSRGSAGGGASANKEREDDQMGGMCGMDNGFNTDGDGDYHQHPYQ